MMRIFVHGVSIDGKDVISDGTVGERMFFPDAPNHPDMEGRFIKQPWFKLLIIHFVGYQRFFQLHGWLKTPKPIEIPFFNEIKKKPDVLKFSLVELVGLLYYSKVARQYNVHMRRTIKDKKYVLIDYDTEISSIFAYINKKYI